MFRFLLDAVPMPGIIILLGLRVLCFIGASDDSSTLVTIGSFFVTAARFVRSPSARTCQFLKDFPPSRCV